MSVAGAWKVVSHGTGWSARADVPAKNAVAAPALARNLAFARNFLIALFVSQFLATVPARIRTMPGRESRQSQGGSNHTLFPSARKERRILCGIFARKLARFFRGGGDGGESRMSGKLPASRRRGGRSVVIQAN